MAARPQQLNKQEAVLLNTSISQKELVFTTWTQCNSCTNVNELPCHIWEETQHFFNRYKELEGKETSVHEVEGPEEAEKYVQDSISRYNEQKR